MIKQAPKRMKVAVFSTQSYDHIFLDQANARGLHQFTYFTEPLAAHTANLTPGFNAVCVFVNDRLDAELFKSLAANGIRVVALRAAGFNNIDLQAAADHGIKVVRVPAYSPQAVAEHAVALILTLNRKTHKAYNRVRENNFSLEKLMGFNLYGKTVGVVGTGQIGSAFCQIMLGFGCRVLAADIAESDWLKIKGVLYLPLEAILPQADIISLHCPLTPQTLHSFNAGAFSRMKPGAMLINTSRGAVIHTPDAIAALRSGQLGYLGIDVYEQEENIFFKDLSESNIPDEQILRLMSFQNVLITAHQGFFTLEAMTEIASITCNNLSAFEQGLELKNEVKSDKQPR